MLSKTRSILKSKVAQVMVEWSVALDRKGAQYSHEIDPHLHYSRHRPILPVGAGKPVFNGGVRIAYTASIEGAVQLDRNVIVGSQTTLRGETSPIRIGEGSVIGDNVSMETMELHQQVPGSIDIGLNVYIGDNAVLRSCIVDDGAYIGEGSFIAEGAIVQRGAIVLPSTTVQPGAILTEGKVWGGNPCREIADQSDKYTNRVTERIDGARAYAKSVESDAIYISMPEPQPEEQKKQRKENQDDNKRDN